MQDRMELKTLVDFYATESDKNNQDCYVEIFRPDIKLNVYFGGKLGMSATDVQDMIRQYKAFGAAKVSFHMNGQQNVDFIDENNATGDLLRIGYTCNRTRWQGCIDHTCCSLL